MTLVARAKPPAHHKKLSGNHHRRSKEYHKAYWPYLPILLIVLGGLFLNNGWSHAKHGVLDYATDMSIQGLLDGTNAQRTDNSLGALSLNAQLDQAAQTKANDMVARDYWSHTTPDNQTPWTFISAAGYNFQTAGENLAYGFDSSSNTITGWMNSPGHRANILNSTYLEVGFGIANSANYQGTGPETVVVAMYASPVGSITPASTPSSAAVQHETNSQPADEPTPVPVSTDEPATTTPTTTQPADSQPTTDNSTPTPVSTPVKPIVEAQPVHVSRVQLLTAGKAPWSITVITLLMASGMLIFFTRHGIAWHKVISKGERFVLKHPALDIAATFFIVAGLLLIHSAGSIR